MAPPDPAIWMPSPSRTSRRGSRRAGRTCAIEDAMKRRGEGGYTGAFVAVTTLFFAWGFITSLVDPLVAAVKGIFELSDLEAQLSASAFFIHSGVLSFPPALLRARVKAVHTVLAALVLMILGCMLMLAAANIAVYPLVLLGL